MTTDKELREAANKAAAEAIEALIDQCIEQDDILILRKKGQEPQAVMMSWSAYQDYQRELTVVMDPSVDGSHRLES